MIYSVIHMSCFHLKSDAVVISAIRIHGMCLCCRRVSTLLGILLFGEFKGCRTRAKMLLFASVMAYIGAIGLLVYAGTETK